MGQDLPMVVIPSISKLNMLSQVLHMVESLLSDENSSSLQTNLAESLLMVLLQVSLQRRHIRELRVASLARGDHAVQNSKPHTGFLSLWGVVENGLVGSVLDALLAEFAVEGVEGHFSVISDNDLVELSFTNGALLVLQNESEPECTDIAHVLVVARTEGEVVEVLEAKHAVVLVQILTGFLFLHQSL
jgi:hypothetical protein